MAKTEHDPQTRRRIILGLFLSGLGMILAVLWGFWAVFHTQTGVLIVTSRPSGAEVILNRRPTDLLTTAFLSDLPTDSFIVSLRMDGYRPIPPTQGVNIQAGDTTRVTFFMTPIIRGDQRPLPPVSGKPQNWQWRIVRISSIPDSAAIILNDKALDVRTPVTVLLEPGLHHLTACWPDGRKAFKNIRIDPEHSQPDLILRPVTYEKPSSTDQGTTP
ncbi:MAG: PEGA domain-containing protein [Calditrichota bacterium]